MSTVLNLRLRADQIERLQRAAREMDRRPSEAATLLLEEALRQREFAHIEFRDSAAGRQAYLRGSRLQAWWIAHLAWDDGLKPEQIADLLEISLPFVTSALAYASSYPEEMRAAIAENQRPAEDLKRSIPNLEIVTIDTADSR